MKVAMCHHDFNKRGGIERYMVELVYNLLIHGDITIDLYVNDYDENLLKEHIKNINIEKINIIKNPKFLVTLSFAINSYIKIKKYKDEYNIIHGHGAATLKQDIITAHSCHKAWFIYSIKNVNGLMAKLKKLLNPIHYITIAIETIQYRKNNCKKIIAVSQRVKDEIKRFYKVDDEKIKIVYNGVNIEEFHPRNKQIYRDDIRKKYGLKSEDIVLLFVASEFKRKGLEFVIKALYELRKDNVYLMVVGPDDRLPYENLSVKLGIKEKVVFTGASKNVKEFFASSDIFIFPTTYEPFGQVITEAMASGIPVITSKCAGAAEIIEDGYDALLLNNPTDVKEIVEKLNLLINDSDLIKKIGSNGRYKVENYTWENTALKTLEIYKEVIGEYNNEENFGI